MCTGLFIAQFGRKKKKKKGNSDQVKESVAVETSVPVVSSTMMDEEVRPHSHCQCYCKRSTGSCYGCCRIDLFRE